MSEKPIDISGYLVKKFEADYRNLNWRFDCPFCGADRQRFSISIPKGIAHCWRCDYTNSVLGFVGDIESVDFSGAFRIIRRYVSVKTVRKDVTREKPDTTRLKRSIKNYIRLTDIKQPSQIEKLALGYLKKRGLTNDDVKFWRLGVSDSYSGYIITPFIEYGRTVYFVARKFLGPGPKYKNPPISEWEVGKSELIYNYSTAAEQASKGINVVEGIFDVFATGRRSIAILGKRPSEFQLSRIMMMNPASINIMLDADAQTEAFELASRLGELFPTKVTIYKSGDPADNQVADSDNKEEVQYSLRELLRSKLEPPFREE